MDGWIKIEDRLPDKMNVYIVYAQGKNPLYDDDIWCKNIVTLAEYAFGEWTWHENDNDFDITDIVTHWMPLPDPPRMEGENEHIVCQI